MSRENFRMIGFGMIVVGVILMGYIAWTVHACYK